MGAFGFSASSLPVFVGSALMVVSFLTVASFFTVGAFLRVGCFEMVDAVPSFPLPFRLRLDGFLWEPGVSDDAVE